MDSIGLRDAFSSRTSSAVRAAIADTLGPTIVVRKAIYKGEREREDERDGVGQIKGWGRTNKAIKVYGSRRCCMSNPSLNIMFLN